jgi:hypothetical protein
MEARLRQYNDAVAAACRHHNIAVLDLAPRFASANRRITYAPDGIHCDTRMRDFEAGILVDEIDRLVNDDRIRGPRALAGPRGSSR